MYYSRWYLFAAGLHKHLIYLLVDSQIF